MITTHNVQAKNLKPGDRIQIVTLQYIIDDLDLAEDGGVIIYATHGDELGTISTETHARADEYFTVFIDD